MKLHRCNRQRQGGQSVLNDVKQQDGQKRRRYILLGALTVAACYLFCLRYGVFGAKVDWISQHSVLPDYFRQQFYDTGKFFPEFAANIGGGQNIYNFAYYGLYNPVLLPSYLLPFVKMSDYMMAVQLLSLMASVILMYVWLRKRTFPDRICVGMAVVFLLSGPMIFHSYNQIMFVNYMPFLLMGLMGADKYFDSRADSRGDSGKKGGMLTVSIFLMIMTSFYFSIGGMLVLVLYGIHRYLMVCDERNEKITLKVFLAEGIRFSAPFVLAVMMSGILLIPTACALTGRKGNDASTNLFELLIPELPMTRFCYAPYGIGMTTLAVTALIALMFAGKWHERVLAWSCMAALTFPVFAYLLNGGLYVRDKVMIPFLPLLCYVLACYLMCLERSDADRGERSDRADGPQYKGAQKKRIWRSAVKISPYILTIVMIYINRRQGEAGKYWKLLILDGIVMLICFSLSMILRDRCAERAEAAHVSKQYRQDYQMKICRCSSVLMLMPAIAMLTVFGFACHAQADRMVSRDFYKEVTDPDIGELINEAAGKEKGLYRTEQLGNDTENAANLNRIWSMDQYVSSVYTSSCHEGYREFRKETFQLEEPFRNFLMQSAVHNPVYQRFMGVRYIVSKEEVPGYEPVANKGEWKVYENGQVSPAAYVTDKVITEEEYRKLEFPYNQLALLTYAVVRDGKKDDPYYRDLLENGLEGREDDANREISEIMQSATFMQFNLPTRIESDENKTVHIDLPVLQEEGTGEKILFLRFRIKNLKPSKDVTIWVEGIRNKLTAENHIYYNDNTEFTYTIPLKDGQESVEITFGKGRYEIADAEALTGMLPKQEDIETVKESREGALYQSEFLADRSITKGNCIAGTIDVERSGYFITTIPYDENFEILADGREVKTEEVNTAFLGFRIEAGKHEIRMMYHAPGVKAGKFMSIVGFLLFFILYRPKSGHTIRI